MLLRLTETVMMLLYKYHVWSERYLLCSQPVSAPCTLISFLIIAALKSSFCKHSRKNRQWGYLQSFHSFRLCIYTAMLARRLFLT